MSLGRTFSLSSKGLKIPAVGLGTWQSPKGEVRKAVEVAIGAGYRHIDCAWIYKNEDEVGQGIKDSGIDRKELWLTSKLWNSFHQPNKIEATLDETLKSLGTSYLDLYLIHWPVALAAEGGKLPNGKPKLDLELTKDPMPTWRKLEEMVEKGKVRNIGISNFSMSKAKSLWDQAKIKPAVNQVELNLHCSQPELVAWSKEQGILLEAYSPLGSTGAGGRDDPVIKEIATAHSVDPANILISWQVQRGCVCLPKSVTPSRIISNFKDVELTKEEMKKIDEHVKTLPFKRTVDPTEAWGTEIWEGEGKAKL